jgi:hypothetical protein
MRQLHDATTHEVFDRLWRQQQPRLRQLGGERLVSYISSNYIAPARRHTHPWYSEMWVKFSNDLDQTSDAWTNRLERFNRSIKAVIDLKLSVVRLVEELGSLLLAMAALAVRGDFGLDLTRAKRKKTAPKLSMSAAYSKRTLCVW